MLNDFLIFVAPILILIGAIALSFWVADKDGTGNNS
ncbi:cytochrome bd oxidase small subunit CydS [Oceanobacillus massiliensis]